VTAKDAFSNTISGAKVVLSSTGSSNNFTAAANTNGSGVSSSTFSSTKAEGKTVSGTLQVGSGSVVAITSGNPAVTVDAAAADHLTFTGQPSSTPATQAMSPAVVVEIHDQFENLVNSSDVVTLSFGTDPSGGGANLGGNTASASGGVATFGSLTVDTPDSGYTLVASDGGLGTDTSTPFTITP
jgi:hypothetical protein